MRKSLRSAAIVQLEDFVRTGLGQMRLMRLQSQEILISAALHITCPRRVAGHIGQFGRIEQHPRIAAFKLHGKLIDIAFLAAKAGRQRQRNWPGARINDTEKQRCKIRPCLRSEEHTSELQSLMRNSYAVFCLKKKTQNK